MNAVLEEILTTKQVVSASGERVRVHSSVKRRDGRFIQDMVRQVAPSVRLSVEVGCGFGLSTLFLCDVLEELGAERHIVIDPFEHTPDWQGIGLRNVERAGFGALVDFREEPSYSVLARLRQENASIDFAFIDGWTTFDGKLVDFWLVDHSLRIGGIVAVRAGTTRAGMKVCRYIAANRPDYEVCGALRPDYEVWGGLPEAQLPEIGEDITAFRKLRNDDRSWQFDVDF